MLWLEILSLISFGNCFRHLTMPIMVDPDDKPKRGTDNVQAETDTVHREVQEQVQTAPVQEQVQTAQNQGQVQGESGQGQGVVAEAAQAQGGAVDGPEPKKGDWFKVSMVNSPVRMVNMKTGEIIM